MKYLIIGNGIAGASAAEELRELEPEADITVVTDEDRPLYNRILMKSHMKGKIPLEAAQVHTSDWYEERDIELHLETRIEEVDLEHKVAVSEEGREFGYDKLLVATGGSPRRLPEDEGFENLHYVWEWDDAERIAERAEEVEKAAVIGGGLLGIDLAVAFAEQGCEVDYLIRGECWFSRGLNPETAKPVHEALEKKGVRVKTETEVEAIESDGETAKRLITDSGEKIEIGEIGVAIGQKPNSGFIEVEKNDMRQIKTDSQLQTSDPDIYAAGDQVEYESAVFGRNTHGSWDHSEAMGRCAARNIAGFQEDFEFVPTYGVGHFRFNIRMVGCLKGDTVYQRGDDERILYLKSGKVSGYTEFGKRLSESEELIGASYDEIE